MFQVYDFKVFTSSTALRGLIKYKYSFLEHMLKHISERTRETLARAR